MYKILLGSIIAMLASAPVFGAPSLTCDASGVGATTSNARMKASWTQNTYNLEWYGDEGNTTPLTVQNSAQSCVYGNALILPSTNPSKVGYTFIGWEMQQCSIPTTLANTAEHYYAHTAHYDSYLLSSCASDEGTQDCSKPEFSDLNEGEWKATWANGDTIKGSSYCSELYGGMSWGEGILTNPQITYYEALQSGIGNHCWCNITEYVPNGGAACSVQSSLWAVGNTDTMITSCLSYCPQSCAQHFRGGDWWGDGFSVAMIAIANAALSGLGSSPFTCSVPSNVKNTNGNHYYGYGDFYDIGTGQSQNYCSSDVTGPSSSCEDAVFNNLGVGRWKVTWENGDALFGGGTCDLGSGKFVGYSTSTNSVEGSLAADAINCWCDIIEYVPNAGEQCYRMDRRSVFLQSYDSNETCWLNCAIDCAIRIQTDSSFRTTAIDVAKIGYIRSSVSGSTFQ